MALKQVLIFGVVIFIGMLLASLVADFFINPLLFAFFPADGFLGLIGLGISFVIFAMLTGIIVMWLARRFH